MSDRDSVFVRLMLKTRMDGQTGCWHWTGAKTRDGYGQFWRGGKMVRAHRAMYEEVVGKVPDGASLDHLCRNPGCVNPPHLEPVTHTENVRRGHSGYRNKAKVSCPSGHAYDEANTRVSVEGWRRCRVCDRERKRA